MTTKSSKPRVHAPSLGPRRLTACIATARSGQRCKAAPMRGTKYCPLHTEGIASKLGEKGGRRRAIFDPSRLSHFAAPKTLEEIIGVVGQLSTEVHQGLIDPRQAQVIGGLMSTLINAVEVGEQGALLEELERRTGLQDSLSQLRDEATGRFQ